MLGVLLATEVVWLLGALILEDYDDMPGIFGAAAGAGALITLSWLLTDDELPYAMGGIIALSVFNTIAALYLVYLAAGRDANK